MVSCAGSNSISCIDSVSLQVCHTARSQYTVVAIVAIVAIDARRGNTLVGLCYGFTLHLVVNDRGALLAFCPTPGTVDDRHALRHLVRRLFGKLFGDRGSISHTLALHLFTTQGLLLITNAWKHMRERLLAYTDKRLCRKRALTESLNDQVKNVCPIEHTPHRSPDHFLAHLLAVLPAYYHQPKKLSLHLTLDLLTLPTA